MMNRTDNYFDKQFQNYDEMKGNGWGMNWRAYMILRCDEILSRLKEEIIKRPSSRILEIGCATGDFTERYISSAKDQSASVLGVDISKQAIDICKRRFADNISCTFEMGKLPELAASRKFDIVLCMDVMEYFDTQERDICYRNICSCINTPGGILLLQAPLEGEKVDSFVEQVSRHFFVKRIDYVYGQLWYAMAETGLCRLVNELYFKRRVLPFRIIGTMAYKIMKNRSIVSFFFRINRWLFPKQRSHIVLSCVPLIGNE